VHFRVSHDSTYQYNVPVSLNWHRLRVLPRTLNNATHQATVFVDPPPVSSQDQTDQFGNIVRHVHFAGTTSRLTVNTQLDVTVCAPPPIVTPLPPLPWAQPLGVFADGLHEFRAHNLEPRVLEYARALMETSGSDPLAWLTHATQMLFARFDRHVRPTGDARTATETLALGSGACRDLAVLFLALCRSQGLAARFVSGYQAQAQSRDGQRHLHAWAEVYLGEAGWRGFDPMHGVAVTDGHLALYAGPTQAATMPIEGGFSFVGAVVNSTLTHSVRIGTD
jgi:transglutaminase-like putative cysteine protease